MIVEAIMNFIHKGIPFTIGGDGSDEQAKLKGVAGKHGDNMKELKE